jgi:glycosyltransferase involved in cell wall biosynthesis
MINDKSNLTVSVVIPTYNSAAFVGAAVESALNQTHLPHEIFVVDDGSTDQTADVLSRFGLPVLVIRQENQGQSAARNNAIARATGDAIMFLDADDLLLPTCIEQSVKQLEIDPQVDVVYSDCYLIDSDAKRIGVFSEIYPADRPSGMILGQLGYCWSVINISSTLVRRTALRGLAFDGSLTRSGADDFDLWRQLAAKSKFRYVDEVLACYRCHSGQMSATRIGDSLKGAAEVQQRIIAMEQFARVAARDKARLYRHHGARRAILGEFNEARQMFWRALCLRPWHPTGYALMALSLMGGRVLRYAILKRRELGSGEINRLISGTAVLPTNLQWSLSVAPPLTAGSGLSEGGCGG